MDGSRLFDDRNVRTKLVLRFLSSAILKSANNFGIIILKSCSLQCVLHDDSIVRQMVECIKVYPSGKLEIIFGGGYLVEESV